MLVSHAFMTVSSNLATQNDDQIFLWIDGKSSLPYQPLMDFVNLVTFCSSLVNVVIFVSL